MCKINIISNIENNSKNKKICPWDNTIKWLVGDI